MIGLPLQGVATGGVGLRDPTQAPTTQLVAETSPAASPQTSLQVAPPAALTSAAASQGGLAPLLADLAAALAEADLPDGVQVTAREVMAFGLDGSAPPSGDDLQAAVAHSGLFLEADLGSGGTGQGDFKAALLDLARALQPVAETGRPSVARATPAPPFAGGAVRGQAVAPGGSVAGMAPEALAARLLGETRAAVSRQVLMQSASSPGAKPGAPTPTRWLFELPVAEGDRRSVAQFEIARDGRRSGDPDERPATRARFSLDVSGLGPVHASLMLSGARVQVALWAEDGVTAVDLDERREDLRAALQGEGLSAEVVVRDGAPPSPPPPAGRFMDTAA